MKEKQTTFKEGEFILLVMKVKEIMLENLPVSDADRDEYLRGAHNALALLFQFLVFKFDNLPKDKNWHLKEELKRKEELETIEKKWDKLRPKPIFLKRGY